MRKGIALALGLALVAMLLSGCTQPQPFLPPPSTQTRCVSSDPVKIIVVSSNVNGAGVAGSSQALGAIAITNLTGGPMSDASCTGRDGFAANVGGCESTIGPGDFQLTVYPGSKATSGFVEISYTDVAGLNQSVAIYCMPLEIS